MSDVAAQTPRERAQAFLEQLRTQQAAYERKFSDLPIIEQLKERCVANNVHPDDPIFLIIEILGLFDERQRATVRELVYLSATHLQYQDSVLDQLEQTMDEVRPLYEESAKTRAIAQGLSEALELLNADNAAFLQSLPVVFRGFTEASEKLIKTAGTYQDAADTVIQIARRSLWFNIGLPVMTFMLGGLGFYLILFVWRSH